MIRFVRILPLLLVISALLFLSTGVAAQEASETPSPSETKHNIWGAGLSMKYPYESFGDEYETGFGIHALMDYPLMPLFSLTGDIGYNHFPKGQAGESIDVWEFVGGMRFVMGVFFMSGEVGYYSQLKETSFLPGLGLKFEHFEIAWNIRAVPSGSWSGLRFGYFF